MFSFREKKRWIVVNPSGEIVAIDVEGVFIDIEPPWLIAFTHNLSRAKEMFFPGSIAFHIDDDRVAVELLHLRDS